MKKTFVTLLIFVVALTLLAQENQKKQRVLDLKTSYTFREAANLISESDLYCSFFISKRISRDVVIIGAEEMVLGKQGFSDGDKLFINRGSVDGIEEGSMWIIIEQGKRIANPFSMKSLGFYHLKKSLGEVTCVYDDKSVVTLMKGCNPVNIGDILVPFKEEDIVFKKKIEYQECRLPESPFEGRVIYSDMAMGVDRSIAGTSNFIAVDLGKALVAKADFLLFFKIIKKNLPPLITGLGIVVTAQNTNSTVKILDASYPIEIGDRVVLIADEAEETLEEVEKVPIVEALKSDKLPDEIQKVEISILFELDSKEIDSGYDVEFERIKEFVTNKAEFVVVLKGYACSIGGLEYNLKISKERVDRVREILISKYGIAENFIESYFYGEKESPFDNTTEEQRRKNRLVQIQVIAK